MQHKPTRIDLDQGSEAWLSWRKNKITASRVPCIMGESPFKTAYQTWEDLLGIGNDTPQNQAMKRGTELEPHVRKLVSDRLDIELKPCCYQHPTISYFAASLDGFCEVTNTAIEIKCGNLTDHEMTKDGVVPLKYRGQLHAIMEVMGLDSIYYCSYYEPFGMDIGLEGDLIIVKVEKDLSYSEQMLEKVKEFWKLVQEFIPPDRAAKDFVVNESGLYLSKVMEYRKLEKELAPFKELEKKKDSLRDELIALTNGNSTMGGGLRIAKVLEKGRVDYGKIPQLRGLNLDPYRKEPITKWRFT